ncbi:hypothetical protein NOGI109294_19790 [Nocardiopsis gilva]|nr:hypothetical protein [Nocardiopsis gilva]
MTSMQQPVSTDARIGVGHGPSDGAVHAAEYVDAIDPRTTRVR